jgi:hypothetical protein
MTYVVLIWAFGNQRDVDEVKDYDCTGKEKERSHKDWIFFSG